MQRSRVERDWSEVPEPRFCRCEDLEDCDGPLQRAHVIGRENDEPHPSRPGWRIVRAIDVVPLCRKHHERYDARALDLLPYLDAAEQARAVLLAGGIISALVRISGPRSTVL